jgi:hypothetical protein
VVDLYIGDPRPAACRTVPPPQGAFAFGADPQPNPSTTRHHRLRGKELSTVNGLEQWQYEVTGGGRLWYLVDAQKMTIWIRLASTAHPKATDS